METDWLIDSLLVITDDTLQLFNRDNYYRHFDHRS